MEHLMGRYRNVSILAAAIFIQIIGLAVQVKRRAENQSTRLVRVWTVAALTPLERNIVRVQTAASDLWHNYIYLRGVRQENRDLQQQIQQLQLEQVRLHQDAEQARRLQTLLGFKEQFIDKTTAAQVIGSSGSEQSRIVYLDKGSADGIKTDMAVISAQGVVGKVIQVFRHTSQVLLINDQTSGVGTILEQSRLQGVLKGKASGELVLDNIMAEEDVKPGERVLTSGGDQIFPKGLPVGTVNGVRRGAEFLQVTVKPAASLNRLEEVLVITNKQEREPAIAPAAPEGAADILAERLPSVPDKPAQAANPTASVAAKPASAATPETGAVKLPIGAPSRGTTPHPEVSESQAATTAAKPQSGAVHRQPVGLLGSDSPQSTLTGSAASTPKPKLTGSPGPAAPAGQHSGAVAINQTNPADLPARKPQPAATAANSSSLPATATGVVPKKVSPSALEPKPTKPAVPKTAKPASAAQPASEPANTGDAPQ
jgi:rod shape-determining protein MreC